MLLLPIQLPLQIFDLDPQVKESHHINGGVKHDKHIYCDVENSDANDAPTHDILDLWLGH
jgi:hypothetical protein